MKKWIPDIVSALLILLFVYTASSKLFSFEQFRMQLGASPWIRNYVGLIAWLIPVIELLIAAMLAVKTLRLYGLYASVALLSIFTFYIGGMLLTKEHLPCSCGGVIELLSWSQHLIFNIFFIALSALGIGAEIKTRMKATVIIKASNS